MAAIIDEDRTVPKLSRLDYQLAYAHAVPSLSGMMETEDDRTTPVVPAGRRKLAKAEIRHLSEILQQLLALWEGEERDEIGQLRPTKQAFDETWSLLIDAAIVSATTDQKMPYGCVSPDAEGGIRVEWTRPERSVRLIVPASEKGDKYIYYEMGADYGTERVKPEALARRLREID